MRRGRKRRRRRRRSRGQPPLNQVQAWTQAGPAWRRLPPGIFSIPSVRTLCEAKTRPRARHSKPTRLTKTTSYTAGLGNDGGGSSVCVGSGWLGASQGRWQKCASTERGQPVSSPHAKGLPKAPGRTRPGGAGKAAPRPAQEGIFPFSHSCLASLSLSLSQGH